MEYNILCITKTEYWADVFYNAAGLSEKEILDILLEFYSAKYIDITLIMEVAR